MKGEEKTEVKTEVNQNSENSEPKGDDETINFSQIKEKTLGFFKNLKTKKKEAEKENKVREDEISFEFKEIITFTKNHSRWLIPLIIIILAISLSTYLRTIPLSQPMTDKWAENTVYNFYRNQLEAQISQQHPNLPEQNRQSLVDREFQKLLEEDQEEIQESIKQISQQYKVQFQDGTGELYLSDIDTYLWYSQARNVVNYGHLGDEIIDGESYFSLRDGRLGKRASVQLHPYVCAYLYKFLRFFNPDISLKYILLIISPIIIGLSLIPAFFIGRKIAGNVGGFFAAIFLAINAPLLSRTPAGFADTDAYNVLFPLLIVWMFLEAYTAREMKQRCLFSGLAGFFVGAFAFAWSGWPFAFSLILGILVLLITLIILKLIPSTKAEFKNLLVNGLIFFLSSALFVTIIKSSHYFLDHGFKRVYAFVHLKQVAIKSIWPNVLTSVAEFNTTSYSHLIEQLGGNLLFFIALLGLIFLAVNKKKAGQRDWIYLGGAAFYYAVALLLRERLDDSLTFIIVMAIPPVIGALKLIFFKEGTEEQEKTEGRTEMATFPTTQITKITYLLLFTIWLLATAYAFSKGMRFAVLIAPPFAIALGSALGIIYEKLIFWTRKTLHLELNISRILIFIILALLIISPLSSARAIAEQEIPTMNDQWYNTLTKIKEDSTNAIITSWWDFGHWFVAIAERKVTFDGGDQGERIHWVGRVLRTDDEQEAIGILRMLNCAQETAPHKLDEFTGDSLKSIQILYQIFPLSDRKEAERKYMELGLTQGQAEIMLDYTHCPDLLPNYFITSEDMVGKAGVWGHFGSWDFEKAVMYQNAKKLPQEEAMAYLTENFSLTEEEADKVYSEIQTIKGDQWISPWPGYLSGWQNCEPLSEDEIRCPGSIQGGNFLLRINLQMHNASFEGSSGVSPDSLVYLANGRVEEKQLSGQRVGFSVILSLEDPKNPEGSSYKFLAADPLQAASLFTKLFFLEGQGLKCFSKFDDVEQFTGGRIITWKVDYDCQQENKASSFS